MSDLNTVVLDCTYNDCTNKRMWFVRVNNEKKILFSAVADGNAGLAACREWLEENHYHMSSNTFPENFTFILIRDATEYYGLIVPRQVAIRATANMPKKKEHQTQEQYEQLCQMQARNLAHKLGQKCLRKS